MPRGPRGEKRPADVIGDAVHVMRIATGDAQETVGRSPNRAKGGVAGHDEKVRGVKVRLIQVDEIWSFTAAKQKNVANMKVQVDRAVDTWTWTALDADTKLLVTWLVGGRDSDYAIAFVDDLRNRLANRIQLTSDCHRAYLEAVEGAFGGDVDYAQLVKMFGAVSQSAHGRYSPAECTGARKVPVEGSPDPKHISTSYAERANLTMRMQMRRPPHQCVLEEV